MKRITFAACLVVCLTSCGNNGNAGQTADTSVGGIADTANRSVNKNSGGSGMTGPSTGTKQSGDTVLQPRMNNTLHKDSVR